MSRYVCLCKLIYRDRIVKIAASINGTEGLIKITWLIHRGANKNRTLTRLAGTPYSNSLDLNPPPTTALSRLSLLSSLFYPTQPADLTQGGTQASLPAMLAWSPPSLTDGPVY